jgi:hypothetical protein
MAYENRRPGRKWDLTLKGLNDLVADIKAGLVDKRLHDWFGIDRGWSIELEHPGFLYWSHPAVPHLVVYTTPNWDVGDNDPDEIRIDVHESNASRAHIWGSSIVRRGDHDLAVSTFLQLVSPTLRLVLAAGKREVAS